MRSIQVRSLLVSLTAVGLVGWVGCGDDSVQADAAVDAPGGERPADARMPDAGPDATATFENISIGVVELHGVLPLATPTPAMTAAVSIGASPSTFMPDVTTGAPPTNGCTASDFDLTPGGDGGATDPPPPLGNLGNVTVTGFQFAGNAIPAATTTITCTYAATGYSCDFPAPNNGIYPEVATPEHWLMPGATLTVAAAGGAQSAAFMSMPGVVDNFDADSVTSFTGAMGTFNANTCDSTGGTAFQLAGPGGIPDNQELLVKFVCGTNPCGIVVVNFSSASGTPASPGPTLGTATCARIITSATQNCILVQRDILTRIKVANWTSIRTSVFRVGPQGLDPTNHRNIVAGRGQFYIKAP